MENAYDMSQKVKKALHNASQDQRGKKRAPLYSALVA